MKAINLLILQFLPFHSLLFLSRFRISLARRPVPLIFLFHPLECGSIKGCNLLRPFYFDYERALLSAPPQAIAPSAHTNLLDVYIQLANKMGFQQK
jgi:hypothetical protein